MTRRTQSRRNPIRATSLSLALSALVTVCTALGGSVSMPPNMRETARVGSPLVEG